MATLHFLDNSESKNSSYKILIQIIKIQGFCRDETAGTLQEFCKCWCKREHVESNALNSWKLNIFRIDFSTII